jgi:hypothetical protein
MEQSKLEIPAISVMAPFNNELRGMNIPYGGIFVVTVDCNSSTNK